MLREWLAVDEEEENDLILYNIWIAFSNPSSTFTHFIDQEKTLEV